MSKINRQAAAHGECGTFVVRVQHRQNGSWQGRLTWVEEGKTLNYRSVWELMKMMENAVSSVCPPEDGERSWS